MTPPHKAARHSPRFQALKEKAKKKMKMGRSGAHETEPYTQNTPEKPMPGDNSAGPLSALDQPFEPAAGQSPSQSPSRKSSAVKAPRPPNNQEAEGKNVEDEEDENNAYKA